MMNQTIVETKIITIDRSNPSESTIHTAADILHNKGLVVAPTETRYGLLANADDPEALERLYDVKGRPATMPTAVFVGSIGEMERFGVLTEQAKSLAEHFLPGPMTLILEAKKQFSPLVVLNNKIGIRLSPEPFIRKLLEKTGFPVSATSANRSGGSDCTTIEEISELFGDSIDLYVDCGPLENDPSTVVDLSGDSPRILRESAVSQREILDILKEQK